MRNKKFILISKNFQMVIYFLELIEEILIKFK